MWIFDLDTYFANVVMSGGGSGGRTSHHALGMEQAQTFLALQLRDCAHGQHALDGARFPSGCVCVTTSLSSSDITRRNHGCEARTREIETERVIEVGCFIIPYTHTCTQYKYTQITRRKSPATATDGRANCRVYAGVVWCVRVCVCCLAFNE